MFNVSAPHEMNETFARAFNTRNLNNLLDLYEVGAQLRVDESERTLTGAIEIGSELQSLLHAPGTMVSRNNFCIEHGGVPSPGRSCSPMTVPGVGLGLLGWSHIEVGHRR
jgi:hypothetical protein